MAQQADQLLLSCLLVSWQSVLSNVDKLRWWSCVCSSLRTRAPGRLDRGGVRRELHQALDLWSAPSKLNIREINSDDADILVCFERWAPHELRGSSFVPLIALMQSRPPAGAAQDALHRRLSPKWPAHFLRKPKNGASTSVAQPHVGLANDELVYYSISTVKSRPILGSPPPVLGRRWNGGERNLVIFLTYQQPYQWLGLVKSSLFICL